MSIKRLQGQNQARHERQSQSHQRQQLPPDESCASQHNTTQHNNKPKKQTKSVQDGQVSWGWQSTLLHTGNTRGAGGGGGQKICEAQKNAAGRRSPTRKLRPQPRPMTSRAEKLRPLENSPDRSHPESSSSGGVTVDGSRLRSTTHSPPRVRGELNNHTRCTTSPLTRTPPCPAPPLLVARPARFACPTPFVVEKECPE